MKRLLAIVTTIITTAALTTVATTPAAAATTVTCTVGVYAADQRQLLAEGCATTGGNGTGPFTYTVQTLGSTDNLQLTTNQRVRCTNEAAVPPQEYLAAVYFILLVLLPPVTTFLAFALAPLLLAAPRTITAQDCTRIS